MDVTAIVRLPRHQGSLPADAGTHLGREWTECLGEASRPVGRHRAETVRFARQALAGTAQTEMVED
ncbi:MAG: hypothetical protein ABI746_08455 [Dermatophilaceae bacterium]